MNEPAKQQELCRLCGDRPPYADGMEVCATCMGFDREEDTLSHAVTNYDPAAEKAARQAEQSKAERPCSSCGRMPSQTRFYPSRKDKCVECIKARTRSQTEEQPKTYITMRDEEVDTNPAETEGQEMPSLDPVNAERIDAMLSAPGTSFEKTSLCTCRDCGEDFAPYHNGSAIIKNYCQECLKKRLKRGIRKISENVAPNYQVTIDLEQDPEIFEALIVESRRERRSVGNQIITILERMLLQGGQQ